MEVVTTLISPTTKVVQDISELVFGMSHETTISAQPGKLTFNIVNDGTVDIYEGQNISVVYKYSEDSFFEGEVFTQNDLTENFFYGKIFIREYNESDIISVTAYDQLRYLQNKDIYTIEGLTASEVFEKVCKDYQLNNYKIVSPTTMKLSPYIHDDETLFDIIERGISYEMINGNWYMIRDNFGTLEFTNAENLRTGLIYSDEDSIYGFSFKSSIDEETYNQIKIVQENRVSKKGKAVKSGGTVVSRDYGFAENKDVIPTWGILRYTEKSDKGFNQAQLDERAKNILSKRDTPKQTFSIVCKGNPRVKAGSRLYIKVSKVRKDLPNAQEFVVQDCAHDISNNEHSMSLNLVVPTYGWRFNNVK